MILLIASVTPVIIFLYLITRKDKHPESPKLLAKCFLGGFLVCVIALIVELLLGIFGEGIGLTTPLSSSIYSAFIVAAGTEELVKWLILKRIVWKHADFDQHYDGIIYAVFVSLGFALIENLLYVFQHGLGVAIMRAILAVPGHGLYAVIMGYFLSLAKFDIQGKQKEYLAKSILIPIVFHGLYDFCLFYMEKSEPNPLLILALVILFTFVVIRSWIVGVRKIKAHLRKDGM